MPIPPAAADAPFAADARRAAARGLITLGGEMHARGWSLATSSNYSVRLSENPLRLLVTASGKHKDRLTEDDFVLVDETGQSVEPDAPKSSAETLLHTTLTRFAGAGAIVHTHSVWNTLLSDRHGPDGVVTLAGYEMLKALPGVTTHDTAVDLAVFPNTQDIAALAEELAERLRAGDESVRRGFLIDKHGLYTWDSDLSGARRCVEALEFLFECEARRGA
ncbi:methylthioribulose 1-phosphate dehydratase [Botrimarina sp.]|uniref:methylthioribulose 1-phosphate dehydratase n=1 Tax=Botrimarina sp. TaxID=2795802 RepID=UPI0032EF5034